MESECDKLGGITSIALLVYLPLPIEGGGDPVLDEDAEDPPSPPPPPPPPPPMPALILPKDFRLPDKPPPLTGLGLDNEEEEEAAGAASGVTVGVIPLDRSWAWRVSLTRRYLRSRTKSKKQKGATGKKIYSECIYCKGSAAVAVTDERRCEGRRRRLGKVWVGGGGGGGGSYCERNSVVVLLWRAGKTLGSGYRTHNTHATNCTAHTTSTNTPRVHTHMHTFRTTHFVQNYRTIDP